MRKTIACKSPYGQGGMGAHFAQLVEEARAAGGLARYYSIRIRTGDEEIAESIRLRVARGLIQYTPLRFSPALRQRVQLGLFDRAVASRIGPDIDVFAGFAGQCLRSAMAARRNKASLVEVHAATPHIKFVKDMEDMAVRSRNIEKSSVGHGNVKRITKEYELADLIYVNSEFTRQSFLDFGFDESMLRRTVLKCDSRFRPAEEGHDADTFDVVYVGRIAVTKGIPDLVDAFRRFDKPDSRLILIGGWESRGMRHFLQSVMSADARVVVAPGDPLPHLHRASVFVNPSYQDGFAYAPMEALLCGVPVVVTKQTGMKEYLEEGVTGFSFEAGDLDAIVGRLETIYNARTTWLDRCRSRAMEMVSCADGNTD